MRAAGPSDPERVAAGIFRKEVTITSRQEIFPVPKISLKYTRGGGESIVFSANGILRPGNGLPTI